ncbi:VOC family protein [Deinococcus sp. KNUC1210]|uniref:VOC family protein n=1 Tax=Deinococcus sp. KNUC1210 TaxID=2917691 RepID=UPI001EF12529|nr:VOC family protein [Deinococcus sp. KNUC1210]ULH16633.1 VOC family protein [Deinococcus sp. KNUC1210]
MTQPLPAQVFPNGARVQRLRVARPTDQLEAVVRFYRDGLGVPVIGHFEDHAGYDGVMLGLPDAGIHLEFTRFAGGSPGTAPSNDNLLVLYVQDSTDLKLFETSFAAAGHLPVEPENPYWLGKSLTFQDPDGWRVVIFDLSASA